MPPQTPSLDIVYAVVFFLGLFFGPSTAAVLGPYAVILLASTAGASFALYRANPPPPRWGWFFTWLVLVAVIFAGGLSVLLERWIGENTANYSVPFVAFAIGATGDDWPTVFRKLRAVAFRWLDKKGQGDESN